MIVLITARVFLLSSFLAITDAATCQSPWISAVGSCFYITENRLNYDDAKAACASMDGRLATFSDDEFSAFKQNIGTGDYWIGLELRNGVWVWNDGTPTGEWVESNWVYGEPDLGESKARVEHTKRWAGLYKVHVSGYICKKGTLPTTTTTTTTTPTTTTTTPTTTTTTPTTTTTTPTTTTTTPTTTTTTPTTTTTTPTTTTTTPTTTTTTPTTTTTTPTRTITIPTTTTTTPTTTTTTPTTTTTTPTTTTTTQTLTKTTPTTTTTMPTTTPNATTSTLTTTTTTISNTTATIKSTHLSTSSTILPGAHPETPESGIYGISPTPAMFTEESSDNNIVIWIAMGVIATVGIIAFVIGICCCVRSRRLKGKSPEEGDQRYAQMDPTGRNNPVYADLHQDPKTLESGIYYDAEDAKVGDATPEAHDSVYQEIGESRLTEGNRDTGDEPPSYESVCPVDTIVPDATPEVYDNTGTTNNMYIVS